jgi:hypothetical protein
MLSRLLMYCLSRVIDPGMLDGPACAASVNASLAAERARLAA